MANAPNAASPTAMGHRSAAAWRRIAVHHSAGPCRRRATAHRTTVTAARTIRKVAGRNARAAASAKATPPTTTSPRPNARATRVGSDSSRGRHTASDVPTPGTRTRSVAIRTVTAPPSPGCGDVQAKQPRGTRRDGHPQRRRGRITGHGDRGTGQLLVRPGDRARPERLEVDRDRRVLVVARLV